MSFELGVGKQPDFELLSLGIVQFSRKLRTNCFTTLATATLHYDCKQSRAAVPTPAPNRVAECTTVLYDKSLWTNNLVTELDLVCDRTWMKALPNYGWFTGMLFTVIILQLSDICGRWSIIVVSQIGLTISVFLSAASTSVHLYRDGGC